MPPPMPGYISKGSILTKLDAVLSGRADTIKPDEVLARLEAGEELVGLAAQHLPLDAREREHLQHDWFDRGGSYWPRQQPVEPVVRLGLVQALKLAKLEDNLPLDCYWVCSGNQFQVTCCVSDQQVTVMFLTPVPPASDRVGAAFAAHALEPIYHIRHTSRGPGERPVSTDDEKCVEIVQPRRVEGG